MREDNIKMGSRKICRPSDDNLYRTGVGLCPVAGFGISSVK
jgi:hypothetical protein